MLHRHSSTCRRTKDGRNSFSWLDYHWNSLALGCTCLPAPGGIYLWEGFWNGFLLGQTCEIPATARGNHFRTFACLGSFHLFICCTGTGLLVEEQKVAETVFSWFDYHWNSLALGCTCLPTPGGIYLWEGFWNGFLLGQTCEIPATARGNHFRTFACLGNFHFFICCTGTGLLVEEQKVAETVFSWLDYHWNSLALGCTCLRAPGGIYLWEGFWNGFLLGQTCEIPATARGNHFRTVVCLDSLDSLDSLDMFICCTGIRLLVEEQKMTGTVLADLIILEIRLCVTTAVSSGEIFYLPICRSLHLLALSFRDVELDNIWPTPFRN